jgi:hypothetical protein
VGVDRPDEDDPSLESIDAHEAHAPDTTGATDGADVAGADVVDGAGAPGERADQSGRREAHVDLRAKADDAYRSHAIDEGCDRVREIEETVVTPAILRIEAQDPNRSLVGLEFRLKGRDRIEAKVAHDMEKYGVPAELAFASVKDAIRYTFQYGEDAYASGLRADCERLRGEGFELVEFRNTWSHEEYKGINSRWRVPGNGQLFEVQFHTRASFEAKQDTHTAYERLRALPPDHEEVHNLRTYQREVTAKIPVPPGAQDVLLP